MALYLRGEIYWGSYTLPKDVAAEHGVKPLVRESMASGDKREAAKTLARRKREARDGAWRPHATVARAGMTVETYSLQWSAERKRSGLRAAARDREMLAPLLVTLGDMRLSETRRPHVKQAVDAMRDMVGKRGAAKGQPYAPMTIHRHYNTLQAMFADAVREELIPANPCSLRTRARELPPREDKTPGWRALAVFTRQEVELLISDERVPEVRRVLYALTFLGGMRLGEAVARRWREYDTVATPLGRLSVVDQHEGRRLKTGKPREVPVHPELARMLAEWRLRYALHYGKHATPDDYIVRNRHGRRFLSNSTWENLLHDLETLGLRRRRVHDARRTFITLARADGARPDLLRWITHGASADILDVYTTPTWASLCEQVSCLRISARTGHVLPLVTAQFGAHPGNRPAKAT